MTRSFSKIIGLTIAGLICLELHVTAQTKFEQESRVKISEVPKQALNFLKPLPNTANIKWYYEEGLKQNSFEAKFKLSGHKFSVEFGTNGKIQDIEVLIKEENIPLDVLHQIHTAFDEAFERVRIRKIQRQYTGENTALQSLLNGLNNNRQCTIKYEIVVKAKKDNKVNLFEILFDDQGNVLTIAEILIENANNLEY